MNEELHEINHRNDQCNLFWTVQSVNTRDLDI